MTEGTNPARRRFLLGLGLTAVGAGLAVRGGGATLAEARSGFFRRHYRDMTRAEIDATLARIERRAERDYGAAIHCRDTAARPGVVFGYALNISKCRGYRDCVRACFEENSLDRDTRYIRVLELPTGHLDLNAGDHTYDPVGVPRPGRDYLPLQCMQCDNPPCVRACPVQATW